jgi:hypothetical protein
MKLNLNNIIAAGLALGAFIFFMRHRHEAVAFLSTAEQIGPGNSPQDMTCGLICIGICGAVLVAIVRLLTRNHRD